MLCCAADEDLQASLSPSATPAARRLPIPRRLHFVHHSHSTHLNTHVQLHASAHVARMDHHLNFQIPPNAMPPPPPMGHHPPPQVFNTFDPATDSLSHLPPDYVNQMFSDSHLMFDESQDAKRRRIARACDMCRKKKIKCDGKMPACTQCINYKTDCVFTQVEKKRSPPKGAKYIQGLENRLGRMEHLLRLSGLLGEDEETDLGSLEKKLEEKQSQSRQTSAAAPSNPASPRSQDASTHDGPMSPSSVMSGKEKEKERDKDKDKDKEKKDEKKEYLSPTAADGEGEEEDVEALSDMMCSLVTNQSGETRYLGKRRTHQKIMRCVLIEARLVLRLLYLLTKRNPMGQL